MPAETEPLPAGPSAAALAWLRCPVSQQALRSPTPAEWHGFQAALASGQLRTAGGDRVTQPWSAAVCSADGRYWYPYEHGVTVLLLRAGVQWQPTA